MIVRRQTNLNFQIWFREGRCIERNRYAGPGWSKRTALPYCGTRMGRQSPLVLLDRVCSAGAREMEDPRLPAAQQPPRSRLIALVFPGLRATSAGE